MISHLCIFQFPISFSFKTGFLVIETVNFLRFDDYKDSVNKSQSVFPFINGVTEFLVKSFEFL